MLDEYFQGSPDLSRGVINNSRGSNNNSKQISINRGKNKSDLLNQ